MAIQLMLLQSGEDVASQAAASALCGGFGLLYIACWGLFALLGIGLLIFWIMMLIDCIQRDEADFPGSTGNSKTMWLIILLVSWLFGLSWLSAVLYYFMIKKKAVPKQASTPAPPANEEEPKS